MADMKFGHGAGEALAPAKSGDESSAEDHLQAVLNSPVFQKAPSLRLLLLYMWEHRGEAISEYALATEALGKKPDFEPKIDATVRVKISRLRQKLKEFYDTEGADSPVQLSIPLGGHELQVERKPVAAPAQAPIPARKGLVSILAAACVTLTVLLAFTYSENRRLKATHPAGVGVAELPPFWQYFFSNHKPASLFLPTPVFFEWTGKNLKARDPVVNDFADFDKSPELRQLAATLGPPKLLQNYTVASDTFGALKLAQYLQANEVTIAIAGTADLSVESAGDQNVILVGVPGTSRQLDELLAKTNFYAAVGSTSTVLNRRPLPGEPAQFRPVVQSAIRRTTPGIVAVLPGKAPGTRLLLIAGNFTYPLINALVTHAALQAVEGAWAKAGSPDFFEMVLNAEIEGRGNTVLRTWPEAIHAVNPSDWK
jgi:hypothetical protein